MNVAATNKQDRKASYSCYGSWVDVSAPGGEGTGSDAIYSTLPGGYGWGSGTSMAAPMVVSLAGLLKSQRSEWGSQLIWDAIVKVADPIIDQGMGSGRINAYNSLKQTYTPSAPSNLNATATAWAEINLTWNDNSDNELGFKIERKTSSSEFSEIASLPKNSTSYQDNNVSAGITYYYRIKAYSVNGDSYSNTDDEVVPDTSPDPPGYLEGHFEWIGHQVELNWSDSSNNEQGFIIERRSEWEPSFQEIGSVGPNVTIFYDPNVSWDTIYHYRVKVYNPRGYAYSQEVIVYVG
jgi:subtilisin family serine protease